MTTEAVQNIILIPEGSHEAFHRRRRKRTFQALLQGHGGLLCHGWHTKYCGTHLIFLNIFISVFASNDIL